MIASVVFLILCVLKLLTAQNYSEIWSTRKGRKSVLPKEDAMSKRILGGVNVEEIEVANFMALIWISRKMNNDDMPRRGTSGSSCGGAIVSRRHVLTAAHCIVSCKQYNYCTVLDPKLFRVLTGSEVPMRGRASRVRALYFHPSYKVIDKKHECYYRHDIGIVELEKPLLLTSKVGLLALPYAVPLNSNYKSKMQELVKRGLLCKVYGWGTTVNRNQNGVSREKSSAINRHLQVAEIHLIDNEGCIYHMKKSNVTIKQFESRGLCIDTNICSYEEKLRRGICFGDSGSPLICEGEQFGVVSWSPSGPSDCAGAEVPDVYSRVDVNMAWVLNVLRN